MAMYRDDDSTIVIYKNKQTDTKKSKLNLTHSQTTKKGFYTYKSANFEPCFARTQKCLIKI